MIGPAEIEDMLADYTELSAKSGSPAGREGGLWPVTQVEVASPGSTLVPYADALERLRRAATLGQKP